MSAQSGERKKMAEKEIGEVTHYYTNLGVGIIKLSASLKKGDSVHFKGHTTDFTQTVEGLQFDHKDIESGDASQEVGIKVSEHVREGDKVYKEE